MNQRKSFQRKELYLHSRTIRHSWDMVIIEDVTPY